MKQIHDRNFNLLNSVTVETFTPLLEPTLNLFTANRRRSQVNSNMTSRTGAQRVPQSFFPARGLHLTQVRGGGRGRREGGGVRARISSFLQEISLQCEHSAHLASRRRLRVLVHVTLVHRLSAFLFLSPFIREPGPHADHYVDASLERKVSRSAATLTF